MLFHNSVMQQNALEISFLSPFAPPLSCAGAAAMPSYEDGSGLKKIPPHWSRHWLVSSAASEMAVQVQLAMTNQSSSFLSSVTGELSSAIFLLLLEQQ